MSHQGQSIDSRAVTPGLRSRFVDAVYASHNRSLGIQKAIARCLARLTDNQSSLNVGAGSSRIDPKVINLDVARGPTIDCCASVECLPFANESFGLVLTQETLEHVQDPDRALREIHRVLQIEGTLYFQVPFIIGYHPGPRDFWRFSKDGIREVVERAGFVCEEVGIAVGPATGFYRIAVEFGSILVSRCAPFMYYRAKGLMAMLLYPIKFLDEPLLKANEADRIAGGYYVIAKKTH